MKKKLLALLLCAALAVGLVPAMAAELVYFPEFSQTVGEAMKADKAWPAIGSSAVPTQSYFGQTDDWETCKKLARDYIDLLVETGDFTVVNPFKVVYGKEGGENVHYSADLRYTGSAPMAGTLKAMRAGGTWSDYGEYHITVRTERHGASYVKANRRNHIEVYWDKALRPEGIDFYAGDDPATTTPGTGTSVPDTGTTTPATNPGNAVGNSDNTFQDMGSAMGYYLEQSSGEHVSRLQARKNASVSYEELLQYAQEYVDLLVGQDNFYLVSTFEKNNYGGTKTCYIRYTGTAPMQESLAAGDTIGWYHYKPFHIKVSVTQSTNNYITVAWDNGLKPVESNRRTPSGARLGSAEKPRDALTVVLGIGYNKMCVGNQVTQVDEAQAEVTPVLDSGRTLVPVSRIVAALGGKSTWEQSTRTAGFELDNRSASVAVGSRDVLLRQGSQLRKVSMDTTAKIFSARTYVPLRYVLEGLGLWVGYEPKYRLVVVSTENLDGEDLIKLPESQRLFASEPVPDTPRKTAEHYTIDGFNYTMEVGEALTLFNSRTAISGYSGYTWDVLEGGELVQVDRKEATCKFYAKRPGVVKIQSHLDETVVNYFGGSTNNTYTYTMTITITAATAQGSSGGLMHWQTCRTCNGTGKIRVGTRQETCPTCLGQKQVLM